jgi:hypothetical protein
MPHALSCLISAIEYALLMRVPVLTGLLLFLLPWLVNFKAARSLLLGLFDVTPLGVVAVTLGATTVGAIVADDCRVIYLHSWARGMGGLHENPQPMPAIFWFVLALILSLPVICYIVYFSNKQNPGDGSKRVLYALAAMVLQMAAQVAFVRVFEWASGRISFPWEVPDVFIGYPPWKDHVSASAGFALALGVYLFFGIYGLRRLGIKSTVPALCSALMIMMLACSTLSSISFFLDLWHVPLLLVLLLWGLVTAQSQYSDHFYDLVNRPASAAAAPTPIETIAATKASQKGRVIVVAANGGGIQAAAWAARVLEGLGEDSPLFPASVRLISSVSGGSLGSACYTYKQAYPEARGAFLAAARSSLDEVAWGLSWPDMISSVFPWITKGWIGRGRALEKAWVKNCETDEYPNAFLDRPLSDWNAGVRAGELPAVIMNATLVETGQRLLFGTTRFTENENCRARVDAANLHGKDRDVAAVTAARLSASFPLVTPAARSTAAGLQPHVVDGGYYDNYGMSTLVEWLDEALCIDDKAVESVLVIQIHGAPVNTDSSARPERLSDRGWFFQIGAPLVTLNNVRGAGQIAHNDLELGQMQLRWFGKVPIHSVTMEFPDEDAPLSWHLTRQQQEIVLDRWETCGTVQKARRQVVEFLQGSDAIGCKCPTCRHGS